MLFYIIARNYQTITDTYDSFEATYVDAFYDPIAGYDPNDGKKYPVTLEFDANAFFKEGSDIPSKEELFQVMQNANYASKLMPNFLKKEFNWLFILPFYALI